MSDWRQLAAQALSGAPAEPERAAPAASSPPMDDLRAGLAALEKMPRPGVATAERWAQVVTDAGILVGCWGAQLVDLGWSLPDLFGLELITQAGDVGLVFMIRGGRILLVDAKSAMIRDSDGCTTRIHYRRDDPPTPIWLTARRS